MSMRSFSLSRVFQYARYHYTVLQSKYLVRLLIIAGLPLLIGVQLCVFQSLEEI